MDENLIFSIQLFQNICLANYRKDKENYVNRGEKTIY